MKKIIGLLLLFVFVASVKAQNIRLVDSLNKLIFITKNDTAKALLVNKLGKLYIYTKPDSGLAIQQRAMLIAQKSDFLRGVAYGLNDGAIALINTGNYSKALSYLLKGLKIDEQLGDRLYIGKSYTNIGNIFSYEGDHRQAIAYFLKAKVIAEEQHNDTGIAINMANLGNQYSFFNKPDSALFYEKQAYQIAIRTKQPYLLDLTTRLMGEILTTVKKNDNAMTYLRKSLFYSGQQNNDYRDMSETTLRMAELFKQSGQSDSSLYYARHSMAISLRGHFTDNVLEASKFLTHHFLKQQRLDSAVYYQQVTLAAKDSLFSQEKIKQVMQLNFAEHERQRDIALQADNYKTKIRFYIMMFVIVFLLVMAIIFWRNNNNHKKARKLLQQQKEQIQTTLGELEITQNQLIQSAKMASLGELTAGIAHEIRNPLNFVNNFSGVSVELLQELKAEAEAGHTQDVMLIADELSQNLEKISHHGKRADSIVKGMMEHSRICTGERVPANINALANKFLKLAYHGLRAKDESFSAELVEHFDQALPDACIMQQDIGRVLANIFNNAFYAVHQKQKKAVASYKPTITVTTLSKNGQVTIKIKDNGDGIPDSIKDKIMQPFFTTKPAGEGTGLGLSLSYDIVVKGHGGSISIDTRPGEFTEFVVSLPIK